MNTFRRLSALLPAIALLSVLGCASTRTQEDAGEYLSDSWITTKVKTALVGDSLVKATEVNVETFKGIVQLSGFVSSDQAMDQAVLVASNIEGVTSVKNDMRIK
jgi:hyperosmotically inducible protein